MSMTQKYYDVLIIGSGAAGLGIALSLAENARIAIISKDTFDAGSSQYAQGGIAAVMDPADSLESHIEDTLNAGDGLCERAAVEFTVKNARPAIEWLIQQGVQFSMGPAHKKLHLTREGGHSARRIIHAADKTGAVVTKTLAQQVNEHQNIDCFSQHTAVDLITENGECTGALVLNNRKKQWVVFSSSATVIATGGASFVYKHTSNPDRTTGDGIAMATRAGCTVKNLEFNQFHPTCFFHPNAPRFLITESIRGEGGILTLPNGERFMQHYDERAELAPRSIVTRAIHQEMQIHNLKHVCLDISHKPAEFTLHHFPTIHQHCLKHGIDITRDPIPVVPAAHYTCGGICTNLDGKTDVHNLYAVGEVAYTGLHGANRIASNSLLECLVFAFSAAKSIQTLIDKTAGNRKLSPLSEKTITSDTQGPENFFQKVRAIMWQHVGIVRSNTGLEEAEEEIHHLQSAFEQAYENQANRSIIECRNLIETALLIIHAAKTRNKNCGLHYNIDLITLT